MRHLRLLFFFAVLWTGQANARTFEDVSADYWAYSSIEILAFNGITAGCGNDNYCPEDSVSRAQMAVFLERGMNGSNFAPPAASGNVFLDVGAGDFAANFIEQLYSDGITAGCGNNNYCPDTEVSRAQMAVFLLRAKYGAGFSPPAASGIFNDVDLSYWAVHWIEALATEGITAGCGNGNYCPDASVTRAQMAVFLVRAFGLTMPPASTDATLANIALSAGTLSPAFDSNTLSYDVTVGVAELTATPVASDTGARITVNGTPVVSGQSSPAIPLNIGLNAVVIIVTAEDGVSTTTYTVVVRRAITTLTSLTVSAGALSPAFDPGISDYSLVTTQSSYSVTPTASDINSSIVVNGSPVASGATLCCQTLGLGNNTLTVQVTAQDGVTTQTYTVAIYRQSTEASLVGLSVSAGNLSPTFSPSTSSYTLTVPVEVDTTTITATPLNANATTTVNGVAFTGSSGAIALSTGDNVLTIDVTAEDGVSIQSYTVTITRLNDDASLLSIGFSAGQLDEVFNPDVTNYSMTVAYPFTTVTPAASDPSAQIEVGGQVLASGEESQAFSLNLGFNAIVVQVTSTDGSIRNYVFSITRVINTDPSLEGLDVSSGDLTPTFAPAQFSYTVEVGFLVTTIDVMPFANPTSTILVNGEPVVVGEASDPIPVPESSSAIVLIDVTAEDGVSTARYTLEVTRQSVASFAQQAYVKASNTDPRDRFGYSVTLHGDTLAVGAYGEDSATSGINGDEANNSAASAGAVYVFARDGLGAWSQQAYLKASRTSASSLFGFSLAIYGDTLAVGAWSESSAATGIDGDEADNSAPGAGAVYIYTRDGNGNWSQQAYVKASNTGVDDKFGYSVSLHGDTLAVGAYDEDSAATGVNGNEADNSAINAGAVYVFTRDSDSNWSQQAYIKASNTDAGDVFGESIALHNDTLAVAAYGETSAATGINGDQSNNSAFYAGAVYVFIRDSGGTWSQQAYVKPSNTEAQDSFGFSVAMYDDTLAVGAHTEDSAATGINGDQASNASENAGAVYVFTRDGVGTWSQQAYIKASNTDASDSFGASVALYGDNLAVGTYGEGSATTGVNGDEADNSLGASGAVYVFMRDSAGTWSQKAYIKASNTDRNDHFGNSVVLHGDTLAVGARQEDSAATDVNGNEADNTASEAGAVYVFK